MIKIIFLFLSFLAYAEKAQVKVDEIPTQEDTTITIKKGTTDPTGDQCTIYHMVSGQDEIFGYQEYERNKAYKSWEVACVQWKQSMKELNKDNQILTLNCNLPKPSKEDDRTVYRSMGTYKLKTKIREGHSKS